LGNRQNLFDNWLILEGPDEFTEKGLHNHLIRELTVTFLFAHNTFNIAGLHWKLKCDKIVAQQSQSLFSGKFLRNFLENSEFFI